TPAIGNVCPSVPRAKDRPLNDLCCVSLCSTTGSLEAKYVLPSSATSSAKNGLPSSSLKGVGPFPPENDSSGKYTSNPCPDRFTTTNSVGGTVLAAPGLAGTGRRRIVSIPSSGRSPDNAASLGA